MSRAHSGDGGTRDEGTGETMGEKRRGGNNGSARMRRHEHESASEETRTLAAFLRELAERAEHDPALAAHLRAALMASGLLDDAVRSRRGTAKIERAPAATRRSTRSAGARSGPETDAPPDPFVLLRERGEAGLRTALEGLDLAALRAIVRSHRLDPARISARWTARERVIELIVTQVRGRANHGKAFARV